MATKDRTTWPGWARALTTGWVLSPLIVIALVLVTFEGYGLYTRHQNTTYPRGGSFGATGEPAAQVKAPKQAAKAHGGHSTRPGATTKGKHPGIKTKHVSGAESTGSNPGLSGTHSPKSHPSSTPSHGGGSGGGSQPQPTSTSHTAADRLSPQTGTYTLAVTGSETAKFGPISACNNTFPSRATLDVHHAAGESATSDDFDMRLYPGQANKHDERHIYDFSKRSVVLSYEEETVTCSGIKMSTTVDYAPAQTRVALPLTVGKSWHNHGGGSSRTETGTSQVVKKTSLSVQGKSYAVYEIATKLTMTGSETGTRDQVWWYSPQLAMPLKFSESLQGQRSGAKYSEGYTASVVSLP
jgi:hypothetical protein